MSQNEQICQHNRNHQNDQNELAKVKNELEKVKMI